LSLCIKSFVFSILCLLGRGANCFVLDVKNLAMWYAGAFLQLTTGLIGCPDLCTFMRPFMEGAVGFIFVYFHLESCGIRVLLFCIVFLIWAWKFLVGSVLVDVKLLFCIKSFSFWSY
jgi:hypothetical protein